MQRHGVRKELGILEGLREGQSDGSREKRGHREKVSLHKGVGHAGPWGFIQELWEAEIISAS